MLPSDKLAVAAQMHVYLRRKTGRVTDTEWMVLNAEYAREVLRFARAKAKEANDEELRAYADKMEQVLLGGAAAATAPAASTPAPAAPRYLRGLR